MIRVEQSILTPPKGNCFAACIASILELPLSFVPNFVGEYGRSWHAKLTDFLRPRNMDAIYIQYCEEVGPPQGFAVLCVEGQHAGRDHCVVMLDGLLAWDPSPNRATVLGKPKSWVIFTVLDPAKVTITSTNTDHMKTLVF